MLLLHNLKKKIQWKNLMEKIILIFSEIETKSPLKRFFRITETLFSLLSNIYPILELGKDNSRFIVIITLSKIGLLQANVSNITGNVNRIIDIISNMKRSSSTIQTPSTEI